MWIRGYILSTSGIIKETQKVYWNSLHSTAETRPGMYHLQDVQPLSNNTLEMLSEQEETSTAIFTSLSSTLVWTGDIDFEAYTCAHDITPPETTTFGEDTMHYIDFNDSHDTMERETPSQNFNDLYLFNGRCPKTNIDLTKESRRYRSISPERSSPGSDNTGWLSHASNSQTSTEQHGPDEPKEAVYPRGIDFPQEEASGQRPLSPDITSSSSSKRNLAAALGDDQAGTEGPRRKSTKTEHIEKQKQRRLACPYQKRDPIRHRDCLKLTLHRIKDVKQHLRRRHRQPEFYCSRCYDIFDNSQQRDEHTRRANCPTRPMPNFEGISEEQIKELIKSSGRSADDQQKWFQVWEVVFPGQPKPQSAFLDNYLEEMVSLFQGVWSSRQSDILKSVSRKDGIDSTSYGPIVNEIMETIFDLLKTETADSLSPNYSSVQGPSQGCSSPLVEPASGKSIVKTTPRQPPGSDATLAPGFDASFELEYEPPVERQESSINTLMLVSSPPYMD